MNFDPREAPISKTETVGIRAILWEHTDYISTGASEVSVPGVAYYLFMSTGHVIRTAIAHDRARSEEEGLPPAPVSEIKTWARHTYGPLALYDLSGWTYGRRWEVVPWGEPARPDDEVQGVHPVVDQVRRLLLTTWKMLSQKVVSLESERPPRAMRRRASRLQPETGDVVVVRLRREYHPAGSEEDAALFGEDDVPWYNHRFLVKGHWRRQPYGENKSETKLIWISPYIKGPEGSPLVIKSKIFSLEH